MKQLKVGGKTFNIYSVTGQVVEQEKHSTIHGGGAGSPEGGYPSTISISTTIHNDILLLDSNGKEHSFQLSNFNLSCRNGNVLTVVWAIKNGQERGTYIAVINNTTSKQYFDDAEIRKMFSPPFYLLRFFEYPLMALVLLAMYFYLDGILMYVGMSICLLFQYKFDKSPYIRNTPTKQAEYFKSNFRLEDYK